MGGHAPARLDVRNPGRNVSSFGEVLDHVTAYCIALLLRQQFVSCRHSIRYAHTVAVVSSGGPVQLEEIVVTARKTEEKLQIAPVSVSAISAATIEQKNITSVGDLMGLAPNLTVTQGVGHTGVSGYHDPRAAKFRPTLNPGLTRRGLCRRRLRWRDKSGVVRRC